MGYTLPQHVLASYITRAVYSIIKYLVPRGLRQLKIALNLSSQTEKDAGLLVWPRVGCKGLGVMGCSIVRYLEHAARVCEVTVQMAALVQALEKYWDAVPFGRLIPLLQQSLRELRKKTHTHTNTYIKKQNTPLPPSNQS